MAGSKQAYPGKKKRHTMTTQIVVDKKTRRIICTAIDKGKKHDFQLFKESKTAIYNVGSIRVVVEDVMRELKIFKIIAAPYPNKRKRFGLRTNLIAAIYNFEL